jgi:transcriptional regulator with XRE-family HTH domain
MGGFPMQRQSIGENLRHARQELRLSQSTVADEVGVSRQAVSAAESGKRSITVEELLKLANLYRLPPNFFLSADRPAFVDPPPERIQRRENVRSKDELDPHDAGEIRAFTLWLEKEANAGGVTGPVAPPFSRQGLSPDRKPSTFADHVRQAAKLDAPPINVYRALACYAIRVRMTGLSGISGAFIPPAPPRAAGVLINSNQPADRQRYSAAHELGHHVLGHAKNTADQIVSPLGRRFAPKEIEADSFASDFLMPEQLLANEIKRLANTESLESQVYRLADRFLVSYQAMIYRLANLHVISATHKEALLKIRPSDIESKLHLRRRRQRAFDIKLVENLCGTPTFPLHLLQSPDGIRQLQELAYEEYARAVDESDRADEAGTVYERVAIWVARTHPLNKA